MRYRAKVEGQTIEVEIQNGRVTSVDGSTTLLGVPLAQWSVEQLPDGFLLVGDGRVVEILSTEDGSDLAFGEHRAALRVIAPHDVTRRSSDQAGNSELEIRSPMPGKIVKVAVSSGDKLTEGDLLVVIEAMKMQNELRSPGTASVESVHVQEGQSVASDELLVSFRPEE